MARPSPVTDEVRRLLLTSDRHAWSVQEVHEAVVDTLGAADYSSVFRACVMFERLGLLNRIDLGDGFVRFDPSAPHHDHIRCSDCGLVAAVPGCVLEGAAGQVEGHTDFTVTGHSLVFDGICADCGSHI